MRSAFALLVLGTSLLNACEGGGPSDDGAGGDGLGYFDDERLFEYGPGRIRFANFVSDGTAGVNVDIHWGDWGEPDESEFVITVPYGEITDFMTPRRPANADRRETAAYFLIVPEGRSTTEPIAGGGRWAASSRAGASQLVALAGGDDFDSAEGLSAILLLESDAPRPPSDKAHVYRWTVPFAAITEGDQVSVAAEETCDPDTLLGGALGPASIFEPGTMGLFLADADTDCSSGSSPAEGSVEGGKAYLLLAKADSHDLDARESVLLEVNPY